MGLFSDLWGTVKATFQIGIAGVQLKNSSANLLVRNAADSADAQATVSKINISGDTFDINSDAAGSGDDWKYTITRPATGMTAAVELTLPVDNGSPNQVLQTDGDGALSWASAASTTDLVHVDTTTVAHNTASPAALLTLPANAVVHQVEVIIDTAFDGSAPTMSVGIAGTTSKYLGTTDVNLKGTAKDRYMTHPGEQASGGTEDIIATLVPDGSSNGSARIQVYYSTPS